MEKNGYQEGREKHFKLVSGEEDFSKLLFVVMDKLQIVQFYRTN